MDKIYLCYGSDIGSDALESFKELFCEFFELEYDRQNQDRECISVQDELRQYITASQCTVVIIGEATASARNVDWEIQEALSLKKGLVAISKPGLDASKASLPNRLKDNLESGSGYAKWFTFPETSLIAKNFISNSLNTSTDKIRNGRKRMK